MHPGCCRSRDWSWVQSPILLIIWPMIDGFLECSSTFISPLLCSETYPNRSASHGLLLVSFPPIVPSIISNSYRVVPSFPALSWCWYPEWWNSLISAATLQSASRLPFPPRWPLAQATSPWSSCWIGKGVLYVIEDALVVVQLHVLALDFSADQWAAFGQELPQLGIANEVN